MVLGTTQPLTEMSTGNIYWGEGGRGRVTALPPSCADCHEIWEPQLPGTLTACQGIALRLPTPPCYRHIRANMTNIQIKQCLLERTVKYTWYDSYDSMCSAQYYKYTSCDTYGSVCSTQYCKYTKCDTYDCVAHSTINTQDVIPIRRSRSYKDCRAME